MSNWFVYVLKCSDRSYYCGITTNTKRRLTEHNSKKKGAKYTRSRRPVELIISWPARDKSHALKKEHEFKSLSRLQKTAIIRDIHWINRGK